MGILLIIPIHNINPFIFMAKTVFTGMVRIALDRGVRS